MQGIGGKMNMSYKDLYLVPDIQLPAGFKTLKFELYNVHRDPIAHLRNYCTKMREAGGKNELLMANYWRLSTRISICSQTSIKVTINKSRVVVSKGHEVSYSPILSILFYSTSASL